MNRERDSQGRFLPGNSFRFRPNDPRTIKAARKGFWAFVNKHHNGDKQAAIEWLCERNWDSMDRGIWTNG